MRSQFLLAIFILTLSVQAHPASVHVRRDAQIALSNVELGAIAEIKSTDFDAEQRLQTLILGESPAAGKVVEWSAAEISKRLRPYSRVLQGVQLKLPDRIKIRRVVNLVTRAQVKAQIEDMLKSTLPDPSWETQLAGFDFPAQGLAIPHDASVHIVPSVTRPQGPLSFEIQVVKGGQIENRQWFSGRVLYRANVAIVQRSIDARSRIADSDVKWEKRDVTRIVEVPATPIDIKTAVAHVPLIPGQVLTKNHLEREAALHFGDDVELIAGDDSFSVSTRGISQQNGFVGDVVKIRSLSNQKFLSGVVLAKGVVRVRY